VYFSGGIGVSINGIFGSMLAITLLTGIFWAEFSKLPLGQVRALPQAAVCAIFFLWLVIPMSMLGDARLVKAMQRNRDAESRFALEVDYLRQQPGPALCESLLRCAYAGKPFVYDPFNATRFITLGKLDANVIVDHLKRRDYRAVQLDGIVEQLLVSQDGKDRFAAPILQAIQKYYRPGLTNEDGVIYLPVDSNQQITQTLPSGQ